MAHGDDAASVRTIEHAEFSGVRLSRVRLTGVRVEHSQLSRIVMRGVEVFDVAIDGEVKNRRQWRGCGATGRRRADTRPSLKEALAVRHDAMALVRGVLDDLTDERLDEATTPAVGLGWPPDGATYPVRDCLRIVLNEEWCHRQYAERDLSLLEDRS